MTKPIWFDTYQDFIRYVNRYMMNASGGSSRKRTILKNDKGEVIATCEKNGCGQVYEYRSEERLKLDILKLK